MGADGGTVPKRSEQVKKVRKEERKDPLTLAKLRLSICALSGLPLSKSSENLVCDMRGNIFNLEAILEHLADPEKKLLLHKRWKIKKMKDLIKLKADINKEESENKDALGDFVPPFVCPFTGSLANGVRKFVALKPCGHVMSHNSLLELTGEAGAPCPKSDEPSTSSSVAASTPADLVVATKPEMNHGLEHSSNTLHSDNRQCPVCQKEFLFPADIVFLAGPSDLVFPISKGNSNDKKRKNQDQKSPKELVPVDEQPPPLKKSSTSS